MLDNSFILMMLAAFRKISINRQNLISQLWSLHSQTVSAAVTPIKTVWGPALNQILFWWNQAEHNFFMLPLPKRAAGTGTPLKKASTIDTRLNVNHWTLSQPWHYWKKIAVSSWLDVEVDGSITTLRLNTRLDSKELATVTTTCKMPKCLWNRLSKRSCYRKIQNKFYFVLFFYKN